MTEEHVEQLRRRILAAPDAATVAKSAQERLFWNSKAHGPEIAAPASTSEADDAA